VKRNNRRHRLEYQRLYLSSVFYRYCDRRLAWWGSVGDSDYGCEAGFYCPVEGIRWDVAVAKVCTFD
jgi:hypothetical protein